MKEAMIKANFCDDQNKNKRESIPAWKIKGQIILILKENKISSIKTWEIIIEGIRVIIRKVLNLKIMQYPQLFLIKTQHKKNP